MSVAVMCVLSGAGMYLEPQANLKVHVGLPPPLQLVIANHAC